MRRTTLQRSMAAAAALLPLGWRRVQGWRARGDRVECPCCGATFSHFRPSGISAQVLIDNSVVGGGHRTNCVCWRCGAYDRDRLVLLYLRSCTEIFRQPLRVLHVAPERSLERVVSAQNPSHFISGDLLRRDVDVNIDVTDLPFREDWFDIVLCNHVLEHVPDDGLALREIFRVLAPGGHAVLQTPIALGLSATSEDFGPLTREDRLSRFGQEDHCRLYGGDYPDRLTKAGFAVEILEWETSADFRGGDDNRFGLIPGEKIFVGRKH